MVSKKTSVLTVYSQKHQVVFHAPVTSGSAHDSLPLGRWVVTSVQRHPTFNYNPSLFWDADPANAKATIAAGPNNPVGAVWIDINKPHYGIHGTPEPGRIGYSASDITLFPRPKVGPASREDAVGTPPVPRPMTTPLIEAEPLAELRGRHLELPVEGATSGALRDSFDETRGSTNSHEAIDIMAPRNTPILAVEDGTVARLFESKAGGTTVYQFDPSTRYVYYYAHLERYADGLREGHHVRRGQVLGYVGTSGNAPKETPHLHFAIFQLTDKKQWWVGRPIDPYDVLK